MDYDALLIEADHEGIIVKEKPLQSCDGRISGKRIAIRHNIETTKEKACILAEEIGHHHTSIGCILDQTDIWNRKQERQARLWAYDKMIGLPGLIRAFEYGCRNRYEVAGYLDVTEEFLEECIACYKSKYGICTTVGDYYIMFIPNLAVGKIDFSM